MRRAQRGAVFAGLAALLSSLPLGAIPIPGGASPCFNDTDCGGPQCGGDVCNWNIQSPYATVDKPYTCNPAGTAPKGMDGWCTSDENCKCRELGAKCVGVYCSFTKPSDAPGGGGGGAGGSTSMGLPSAGGPAQAGTTAGPPQPEPVEPATPVGRDDTTPRTSRACAVAAAGNGGIGSSLALIFGWGAIFAGRRKRLRFIPQ